MKNYKKIKKIWQKDKGLDNDRYKWIETLPVHLVRRPYYHSPSDHSSQFHSCLYK